MSKLQSLEFLQELSNIFCFLENCFFPLKIGLHIKWVKNGSDPARIKWDTKYQQTMELFVFFFLRLYQWCNEQVEGQQNPYKVTKYHHTTSYCNCYFTGIVGILRYSLHLYRALRFDLSLAIYAVAWSFCTQMAHGIPSQNCPRETNVSCYIC